MGGNGSGRKDKFTEEIADSIVKLRENGLAKTGCAQMNRISKKTLDRWLESGKKYPHSKFRDFYLDFKKAEAKAGFVFHQQPLNHTTKDDTHMKELRRLLGDEYDYADTININVDEEGRTPVEVAKEEFRRMQEDYEKYIKELEK